MIQRDFGYTTKDIRAAYKHIKEALLDPKLSKVVVVVHSQGGLIMSIALDNLLADLPRSCTLPRLLHLNPPDFQKLEIFTFGCAANHFNNPRLLKNMDSKSAVP